MAATTTNIFTDYRYQIKNLDGDILLDISGAPAELITEAGACVMAGSTYGNPTWSKFGILSEFSLFDEENPCADICVILCVTGTTLCGSEAYSEKRFRFIVYGQPMEGCDGALLTSPDGALLLKPCP